MIGFFTNLFYYQRLSVHLVSPSANTARGARRRDPGRSGGLVVGLMARFGSEQIRGHGIPEAMERILINGSRVQPRLALLKPISSAVSIGSGRSVRRRGSDHPDRRRRRLRSSASSSGSPPPSAAPCSSPAAAAGMSAVFGTPVAATLFGVELLAFECDPAPWC